MPDLDLKKFDLEHWWRMIAALGGVIVVASIAVKFVPTILLGLGIFTIGIAEWMQHPEFQHPYDDGRIAGIVITQERRPRPIGFALDVLGALLCLAGLVKLLLA